MCLQRLLGYLIGLLHVDIMIAVIPHEHQRVLPCSGILIVYVTDGFVYHNPGLLGGCHGHSAHRQVGFAVGIVIIDGCQLLVIIEQCIEIVCHIAFHGIERVLAFIAQQVIGSVFLSPVGRQHAIIPQPVAHQQQVARLVLRGRSTVVEHF